MSDALCPNSCDDNDADDDEDDDDDKDNDDDDDGDCDCDDDGDTGDAEFDAAGCFTSISELLVLVLLLSS